MNQEIQSLRVERPIRIKSMHVTESQYPAALTEDPDTYSYPNTNIRPKEYQEWITKIFGMIEYVQMFFFLNTLGCSDFCIQTSGSGWRKTQTRQNPPRKYRQIGWDYRLILSKDYIIKAWLCLFRTNMCMQRNPVFKAFHRIRCCPNNVGTCKENAAAQWRLPI